MSEQKPVNPCDTKKFYDSEFEAQVAASKIEGIFGEEMVEYQCGTHWHITHVQRQQRRGVGSKYWRCPDCYKIMKLKKVSTHECDIT